MYIEEKIRMIKEKYPIGTRIKLNYMEDNYSNLNGMIGTVDFIDEAGQIHMKWDNGSTLALIYGVDSFESLKEDKTRSIRQDKER